MVVVSEDCSSCQTCCVSITCVVITVRLSVIIIAVNLSENEYAWTLR